MPELPEVETVRKGLAKRLVDFSIKEIEVITERSIASEGGAACFVEKMQGLIAGQWKRKGKYLICNMHSKKTGPVSAFWVVHLRMTGQFQWFDVNHSPCKHTRVRLWDKKGSEIRFVDTRNFGQMWWVSSQYLPEEKINGLLKLGPEPFSKDFNPSYLEDKLKNRKRSIKASLLDQSIVAGTGNIYADETLFEAGILPTKQSNKLTKIEISKVCKYLNKVLKESIGKGGTTFQDFRDLEGLNGNYGSQAWVYGRSKKPCRKCGNKIVKNKVSGRGTHWCPNCQK